MKKERDALRDVLQDIIETDQRKKESKAKKYMRIALSWAVVAFFALVIVMAALRRFGS